MNIEEQKRKHLKSDGIMKVLQDDLAFGRYKPGEKLPPETELMKIFSAGRSSVREALKKLENLGYLTIRQGAGTFVNTGTDYNSYKHHFKRYMLKEINDVRQLLEKEIIKLAVRYADTFDIERIQTALEDRKNAVLAKRYDMCTDADIRFHTTIAEASHNKALSDLYRNFSPQLKDYFENRDSKNIDKFALSHGIHEQLLRAIMQRDQEQAYITLDKLLHNNYWKYGYF